MASLKSSGGLAVLAILMATSAEASCTGAFDGASLTCDTVIDAVGFTDTWKIDAVAKASALLGEVYANFAILNNLNQYEIVSAKATVIDSYGRTGGTPGYYQNLGSLQYGNSGSSGTLFAGDINILNKNPTDLVFLDTGLTDKFDQVFYRFEVAFTNIVKVGQNLMANYTYKLDYLVKGYGPEGGYIYVQTSESDDPKSVVGSGVIGVPGPLAGTGLLPLIGLGMMLRRRRIAAGRHA